MCAAAVPTVFLVLPKPLLLVTEKFTGVFYNAIEKRRKCFLFRKHWGKKKRTSLIYFDSQNTTSLCSLHANVNSSGTSTFLSISGSTAFKRPCSYWMFPHCCVLYDSYLIENSYWSPVLAILLDQCFHTIKRTYLIQ